MHLDRILVLVPAGILLTVAAVFPCVVLAATIHVPGDQPTVQAGLNAAGSGDTVLVACGTYYEHDISMKSGVCLRSETGKADCVTIHAQGLGRVLYCDGVDNSARIEGFTITGGLAMGDAWPPNVGGGISCVYSSPALSNCTFSGNSADQEGGGLYCYASSPAVTNCAFSGNSVSPGSGWGGGMACWEGSSPMVTNCAFYGNSAKRGGGMFCHSSSSPTVASCIFSGNSTNEHGGAMCCSDSSPTLTNCTFSGNSSDISGGGIWLYGFSSATLTNCTFSGNSSGIGGGMSSSSHGPTTLTNCTFCGNHGGGLACLPSVRFSLTLENTIIAFSTTGLGIYCSDAGSIPLLTCCDLYGNAGGDWVGCIAGQAAINGNFSSDPFFCAAESGDVRLSCTSPCVNRYGCGQIGALGVGCGPTSVEYTTWGRIKSMFR